MREVASERARLGMEQSQLAEALGVSTATVSRWERGELKPGCDALVAMHDLFGCSVDYLLGITDERKAR